MKTKVSLDKIYVPSEDVVARTIDDELIIVPIVSGVGDMEDNIFTLNETGRAIWNRLNGKKSLKDAADELSLEFEAPAEKIKKDIFGLIKELLKRRMVIELKQD